MPQEILDFGDVFALIEKVNGPGVSKTVNWIDGLKTLRRQGHVEIFSAKAIDAVPGEFLRSLTDKDSMLVGRFWSNPVFADVKLEKLSGLIF